MKRLVIATRNQGKVYEIRQLLGEIPCELISLENFANTTVPDETESTYEGNAILKARHYANETGEFVLADDSGLEVMALGGKPGVLSARYAGEDATDEERRRKLLSELGNIPSELRGARFVCAAVIAGPEQVLNVTKGICEGRIALKAQGTSGFGYDPIFVPHGFEETFGQLSEEIKNQISHRARALAQMRDFLVNEEWSA
ncbi:MAG TPA: RdgB/HAM1 family non-canonical purine NTP pyrophosphatase [Pyrinomonadaceae bacterium]